MALKAGTQGDFANSLGELIEQRLDALLRDDGLPGLPSGPEDQVRGRRHLFLAIAQAVVEHLAAHPEAFKLVVSGGSGLSAAVTAIDKV
ncbi:MAG: hypothetical protein WAS21_03605 [Geminicoccaceae bacterium]